MEYTQGLSHSCALIALTEESSEGGGSYVVSGVIEERGGEMFFGRGGCNGFPLPEHWKSNVMTTPPDQYRLLGGCSCFLTVQRKEVDALLKVFHFEKRWGVRYLDDK